MFVQAPVTTIVSTPRPASSVSSRVPCHPDIRIFSTTKSPGFGSRPLAGLAPHVPRTSAFVLFTPSKSGAFCFKPGAPFSTMYQTWITGAFLRRNAAASFCTFATTFCSFACCGEPVSANAPLAIITSFCRSWIRSAVRFGFSFSFAIGRLLFHVRLAPRADLRLDRVERGRARDEQGVPVGTAPGEVAGVLRDLDHAEVLALGADHPDAAGAGDPDVAFLVALHPVRDALLDHAGADALEEHPPVRERAVGVDVVDLDPRLRRFVDVEQRLVGREAEPVRLLVLVLLDDQLRVAAAWRDAEDALPAEHSLALEPEDGHAPVPGVGEPERPVGLHADVVRAVQLLALVVRGQHLAAGALAVRVHADERAGRVLANDQPAVRVEGHPVALVTRARDDLDATLLVPAPPGVGGHVGEEQELPLRVPDRPLREGEAGAELLDLDVLVDEPPELVGPHVYCAHAALLDTALGTGFRRLSPRQFPDSAEPTRCARSPSSGQAGDLSRTSRRQTAR